MAGNCSPSLRAADLTFYSVSFCGLPDENIVTVNVFYKRMHGVLELFISAYSDDSIQNLAGATAKDKTSFIYFNNTMFEAGFPMYFYWINASNLYSTYSNDEFE